MKKLFTLIASALFAVGANAQTSTVTYAVQEGDAPKSGTTVEVTNEGNVVATLTYGVEGGADFKEAKASTDIEGFVASTEGNGENGGEEKGTVYIIKPNHDGEIEIGVVLNADKGIYITENGTPLEGYDNYKYSADEKYKGTFKFNVKAGKVYKAYCTGSKLGFYGFIYTYDPATSAPEGGDDPSTGEGDDPSTGGNEPTPEGAYIAWVYQPGYGAKEYAFATDPIVLALKESYEVVEVGCTDGTNPYEDEALKEKLLKASVVVVSEAMTGNKALSNGMKNFVGQVPMIALKAYNYNDGRWGWGAPSNPSPAALSFTASATYKVLDGVTYEEDGTIKVATETETNAIQTVEFGAGAPEDMVTMGTVEEKAAMYASNAQKFFGIGLSSDCWSSYTANAGIIIKNAAAMLMAGEDLTATAGSTGISNTVAAEKASAKTVKVMQDGRLVIKKGDAEFSVSGAQLK